MKLWADDLREPPRGYRWAKSVNEAKKMIIDYENMRRIIQKNGWEEV